MQSLQSRRTLLSPALDLLGRAAKSRTFSVFLAIDCALILIHLYVATRPWETPTSPIEYLRIDNDISVSKLFECGTLVAGLGASVALILRTRAPAYWMVSALILYLLIDDTFGIHEVLGSIFDANDPYIGKALPSLLAGLIFVFWAWFACGDRAV